MVPCTAIMRRYGPESAKYQGALVTRLSVIWGPVVGAWGHVASAHTYPKLLPDTRTDVWVARSVILISDKCSVSGDAGRVRGAPKSSLEFGGRPLSRYPPPLETDPRFPDRGDQHASHSDARQIASTGLGGASRPCPATV